MENQPQKPWYKKKGNIAGMVILAGVFFTYFLPATTPQETAQSATERIAPSTFALPQVRAVETTPTPQPETSGSSLSNDNHYVNTAGNTVHSPAYSNLVPAGASAQCRDGTYSFSQSRRGTCSHHSGVAEWL